MIKIIDVAQLLLLIPALLAAITAFVLGAKPVQPSDPYLPQRKMRHVFREPSFLLSPASIVSLITAALALVAILTRPLTADTAFRNPSVSIFPTATTTSSGYQLTATIGSISVLPFTATPTPTLSPTPTTTPTFTITPTTTSTSTLILTEDPDLTPDFSSESPDPPIIATPTPAPTASPSALIPEQCIGNDTALDLKDKSFGFVEPISNGFQTNFKIRIGEAANYTIRYAREDMIPGTKNINDWTALWTCVDIEDGTRCQRNRPGINDINGQGEMLVSNISWVKEDAVYTFLLQIELKQGNKMQEMCAYVYGVR